MYAEHQRLDAEVVKVTEAVLTYVATDEARRNIRCPPFESCCMTQSSATPKPPATPRRLDPEDAQHALAEVQGACAGNIWSKTWSIARNRATTRPTWWKTWCTASMRPELATLINGLHPADIAFILESLPKDERQTVWRLVSTEHDADVLIEVEDWVRESLIEAMDRQDLVAATGSMDADKLADLAPDLPPDVVAEVQKGLTEEERAQLLEAMGYPRTASAPSWTSKWSGCARTCRWRWCCATCAACTNCPTTPTRFSWSTARTSCKASCRSPRCWSASPIPKCARS